MKITLKPEQEKVIKSLIESGHYPSADEAISAAIELLTDNVYLSNENNRDRYQNWVEETRKKLAVGLEKLARGEGLDGEEVIAKLQDKLNKARENKA